MNEPDVRNIDQMRRLLLALLPSLVIADAALAQDPAKIQPRAFRVVFENDKLRVLEFNSRPGLGVCGTGMHSHPAHLVVALSPGKVRVKLLDGKTFTADNKLGDVFWSEPETHEAENISGKDMRALMIELKPAAQGKA